MLWHTMDNASQIPQSIMGIMKLLYPYPQAMDEKIRQAKEQMSKVKRTIFGNDITSLPKQRASQHVAFRHCYQKNTF
jgi:hypothetical protein